MSFSMRLAEIAACTGGRLLGEDRAITGVAIDSRTTEPGAIFVALRGAHFDGHAFAAAAAARGAAALLVARELPLALAQVVVADPERALGALAAAWRRRCRARVAGITGSNGKTTVKNMLGAILARHGRSHLSAGNFNNEIGLPLSVLAMPLDAEFAVFEMGAGKPGDIAYLAAIAAPDVALVNNVAAAHLERLGNLQGVAAEKGEIYRALPADGLAVINADDAFAGYFSLLAEERRTLRFGLLHEVEVGASFSENGLADGRFQLHTPHGHADLTLSLPGRHNVMNALAASSVALALGAPLSAIAAGLAATRPTAGRQSRHRLACGALLIDDSYNANPGSFAAAIATLAALPGRSVLVMGDMAELGADAAHRHAEVGALAERSGLGALYAVGPLSAQAARAFGRGGHHFDNQQALVKALDSELHEGVNLLVKASRSAAMERVVQALLDAADGEGGGHHAA